MKTHFKLFALPSFATAAGILLTLVAMASGCSLASTPNFVVPDETALRIRLDDTLTSIDSNVGDPISARVVDEGDCQNARVYGNIAKIEISGRVKGHTSMMLRFDRLVMPDGRRGSIHAEIIELYHAPSGGRGHKSIENTAIGAGAGALRSTVRRKC